jgi:hypothetical protein
MMPSLLADPGRVAGSIPKPYEEFIVVDIIERGCSGNLWNHKHVCQRGRAWVSPTIPKK